jgi:hypothetical protein
MAKSFPHPPDAISQEKPGAPKALQTESAAPAAEQPLSRGWRIAMSTWVLSFGVLALYELVRMIRYLVGRP